MREERRGTKRLKFGYYMRVFDNNTQELVGYLSDVSPRGFKIDSVKPLPINKDYSLRLDMTSEISDRPYITFTARAMWSQPDPFNPGQYVEGFQIINISPYIQEIYQRIVDKYSRPDSLW
jgi:hypothetical protein